MITISSNTRDGFCPVVRNPQFLCAIITHSAMYSEGKVTEMKRHNDTDEVFVLLSGNATLLTRDNINEKCQVTKLSLGTVYTVKSGTWHYLAVSADAKVFVTENGSIDPQNTDKLDVDNENIIAKIL
jgi:oxalate decarboxylase/phosphoglucose isomerase-like protein (cupin superfamily)